MEVSNPEWVAIIVSFVGLVGSLVAWICSLIQQNKRDALENKRYEESKLQIEESKKIAEMAKKEAHEAKEFTYFANVRPWFLWHRRIKDSPSASEKSDFYNFQVRNYGHPTGSLQVRVGSSQDEAKNASDFIEVARLDSYCEVNDQSGVVGLSVPPETQQAFVSFEFDDKHGKRWREMYRLDRQHSGDRFVPIAHEEIQHQVLLNVGIS